jgi:cytochrome oxidase Cu insertion factor (SCO1/SenC/PrrC family)
MLLVSAGPCKTLKSKGSRSAEGYSRGVRGLLLVAALCALLAGCGGESEERAMPAETAPAEAAQRPEAPSLDGVDLDGERISLADLRGRPVLINVWSSW